MNKKSYYKSKGFNQAFDACACDNCNGCNRKSECLYKYDETRDKEKNKIIKVNENWERLKATFDVNN